MTDGEQAFWDQIFNAAFARYGDAKSAEIEARAALDARRKAAKPSVVPAYAGPFKGLEGYAKYRKLFG